MPKDRESGLTNLLVKNRGIKILSLILAVITWFAVREEIGVTGVVDGVPIEIQTKEGMSVLSQSISTVAVTFKGAQEDMARLSEAHVKELMKAVVSAKNLEPGLKHTVAIRPRNIDGTRVLRTIRVKPNSVTFQLGREGERPFLVKARLTGEAEAGLVVAECEPASVRVTGPIARLDQLQEEVTVMLTEPISIDGITESFSKRVRMESPSEQWQARIEPSEVMVHVRLEKHPATVTKEEIPVSALVDPAMAATVEMRPTEVTVQLEGEADALESIETSAIKVFVDCQGLDMSATYRLPLTVIVVGSEDVRATANPSTVEVVLSEALQIQPTVPGP